MARQNVLQSPRGHNPRLDTLVASLTASVGRATQSADPEKIRKANDNLTGAIVARVIGSVLRLIDDDSLGTALEGVDLLPTLTPAQATAISALLEDRESTA